MMSGNHYPHVPPPINIHTVNAAKQKTDFGGPPISANQWPVSQPNEFENREKYMETQLTEENYSCDTNANQNEVSDDVPYPPPGLRRLVPGQTVSFDDGPASPPFDRVVPGEGNTFCNYPPPPKSSKPPTDQYGENLAISERFVSGSTTKEYNPMPYQPFVPPPPMKKDINAYNNGNFHSNVDAFNSSTQDFFDSYLRGNSHDTESIPKSNQYSKNKFASLPSGFQNYDADKRENYFQTEKPGLAKNSFNYNDDFNRNTVSPYQANFPPRPASHIPPEKNLKSVENMGVENDSNDTFSRNRQSFENFVYDQPSFGPNYENYYQKHNTSQRPHMDENTGQGTESKNFPKLNSFQPFDASYPAVNQSEYPETQTYSKEKAPYYRADVEGSSDTSYVKPSQTYFQMQSPNYESWYINNSPKTFPEPELKNDHSKLLKEQNTSFANKYRNDKNRDEKPPVQNPQPLPIDGVSPRILSPASTTSNPYENTQIASNLQSNTNVLNENLSHQNENFNDSENLIKRYEPINKSEIENPHEHPFRSNDEKIKPPRANKNSLEVQQIETEGYSEVKQFPAQDVKHEYQKSNYEFHNFENIPEEQVNLPEQFPSKRNPESNQEETFVRKEPPTHDRSFVDQSLVVEDKEANLKSPYRRATVGNEERVDSDGISLERGTVPGAQSTPNDNQPSRQFPNANTSNYNNVNLFKTIKDEDGNEEDVQYTDSDEKPYGRRMVLDYDTIPGARNSRKTLDSSLNKPYQFDSSFNKSNKIDPPFERRMVVGETSSDLAPTAPSRSREEVPYDEEKSRRVHPKDKDTGSVRYERDRKKPLYDRSRRKVESDDDDYEDYVDRTYDDSPDRESRSYHEKHYRTSPRRLDKRSMRRERDNSFTQSQDESYFGGEDDDYDTYRNQRRFYERRYPRDSAYKYNDPYYRDERYRDRRQDYYGRFEDEYYARNSRPSSRSGSEYRRDFVDYTNPRYYNRPPYYEYLDHRLVLHYGGRRMHKRDVEHWSKIRDLEPQKYMNWFKFTFPKEYLEWYSKYVTGKLVPQGGHTYQGDRRGSGHSGQSSVNNDTISVNEDNRILDVSRDQTFKPVDSEISTIQETRCSPAKFTLPHVKGIFNSLGQLVMVNACSPQDGQPADIDFYQILLSDRDADLEEFMNFTGPFVVGETHFNTLRDFVRYHASISSHPSEKLLYQLIDQIIGLRGVTDGIAIADLLMDSYRESEKFNVPVPKEEPKVGPTHLPPECEIIEKYTDLLLQGYKGPALDYAINNKLWGHAFLFASKMGASYYSNVLAKFDASIATNSPLKTLYQLYSKQIPQAATACADEKWGDWRPHLAMILSNQTSDVEFDKQAVITLGDSLSHKDIYAAHFCYLAAQAEFDSPNKASTKYTLLTLRNNADSFGINTPNHAILLTQVYEYAKRLQKRDFNDEFAKKLQERRFSDEFVKKLQKRDFTIDALLPYKYLLATRLIDYGKVPVALQYLESIALDLIRNYYDQDQKQNQLDTELLYNVIELSEKLKFSDAKPLDADSSSEKEWLNELRRIANNHDNTQIAQCYEQSYEPQFDQSFSQLSIGQQSYTKPNQTFGEVQMPLFISQTQPSNQPMSLPAQLPPSQGNERRPSQPWDNNFNTETQSMMPSYGYGQQEQYSNVPLVKNDSLDMNDNMAPNIDQANTADNQSYYSQWDVAPQSISMTSSSAVNYFDTEENKKPLPDASRGSKEEQSQPAVKEADKHANKDRKTENGNGNGWLGGFFGKLIPRPKNEMKLPDDKNPSIVWSEEKKRWVDVNGDDDDGGNAIKPPPKASELKNFRAVPNQMARLSEMPPAPSTNFAPNGNKPPAIGSNNMYQLSRGKGMKANYVNVLSQNTTPSNAGVPPPNAMMDYSKTQVPPNMKLFVPSDGPASLPADISNQNARNANQEMPMFFNPAQYNS